MTRLRPRARPLLTQVARFGFFHPTTVLARTEASLAPLGGFAGLDPRCGPWRGRRPKAARAAERKASKLKIYQDILLWLEQLVAPIERIANQDPDLARQLKRVSRSVALNTCEGSYARGRARTNAYSIALREARESYSALEIAVRLRYILPLPADLEDRSQKIIGTLVRLVFPKRT